MLGSGRMRLRDMMLYLLWVSFSSRKRDGDGFRREAGVFKVGDAGIGGDRQGEVVMLEEGHEECGREYFFWVLVEVGSGNGDVDGTGKDVGEDGGTDRVWGAVIRGDRGVVGKGGIGLDTGCGTG